MSRLTRVSTKVTLVLLLALSIFAEAVIVPAAAREALLGLDGGQQFVPLIVIWGVVFALCGQLMILVIWRLVSLAHGALIFTEQPLRAVRLLATLPFVSAGLLLAAVVVLSIAGITPPIIMYGLLGALCVAVVVGLILITMRSLLIRAIALSTEMEQVV